VKLKKHQEIAVQYIHSWKRCIVGDDIGLGKTAESIVAIDRANSYPLLIICPASLKVNWEIEFNRWTGKTAMILNDSIKNTYPIIYKSGCAHAFIVNYESLSKYFVHKMPDNKKDMKVSDIEFNPTIKWFKSVIFDEGHRVKEPKTIQTKLTAAICQGKEYVLDLTGTPVLNNPIDLAAQLAIIGQIHHFGGFKYFCDKYAEATTPELIDLQDKLKSICYFRREKKEVLDLPPLTRQVITVDIDNEVEYRAALKDLAGYLRDYKGKSDAEVKKSMRGEVMVRIGVLKTISARGKLSAVRENIQDMMETGEKVCLFGHHREVLDYIKDSFPGCVSVTGQDNYIQRQRAVESYQNNPETKLIVCSINAAGVGLTLTKGRITMFIEQGWHAAIMNQCEGRQHRMTQEREVHAIYFLGRNTIDQWIYDLIEEKRDMANAITGATDDIDWGVVEKVIDLILEKQ